jgi:hypothetical protein
MTMTPVFENDYQYSELIQRATDIPHTNGTTRTLKHRELVVVVHNTNQYFIGFVAEPGGIAAGATGRNCDKPVCRWFVRGRRRWCVHHPTDEQRRGNYQSGICRRSRPIVGVHRRL